MTIGLTTEQEQALAHLRSAYQGPEDGPDEFIRDRPDLRYIVGHLFPQEATISEAGGQELAAGGLEEEGDERTADLRPEEWRPSSMALSFITDASALRCTVSGATYSSAAGEGESAGWRRTPWESGSIEVTREAPESELNLNGVRARLSSAWRSHAAGNLVTVSIRNLESSPDLASELAERMLFQVELAVQAPGSGFREYVRIADRLRDAESEELALRYRDKQVFAIGHGVAAEWAVEGGHCEEVRTSTIPSWVVPTIRTTSLSPTSPGAVALRLDRLSECAVDGDAVRGELVQFVSNYEGWLDKQSTRIQSLEARWHSAAAQVDRRARIARRRMLDGIEALRVPEVAEAFALAMAAMRVQMQRSAAMRDPGRADEEPAWRPFQLGFILAALASTVDERHEDRQLVDLIWFPTGGGKTEAYLGLAATEIFRRRITRGAGGGGTSVLTRYTMRLLTAQQFQRTALLICAMELLRRDVNPRAATMAPFSIGLWVGNETTPATRKEASELLSRLYEVDAPREQNPFQVESCPWCGTPLLPQKRSSERASYGPRHHAGGILLGCPDATCEFAAGLPMVVVDEEIYDDPPTIVLATVDKLARLQFVERASRVLGVDTIFDQPSMIIQDELHLLSGPLGTTVGVFESAILGLLETRGASPKVIASTATIRAADEQVSGLYGRAVALYPPAGIDENSNFFSEVDEGAGGRLYLGLMPVSLPQATALVSTFAPLFELSDLAGRDAPFDPFWTLVAYHNSLRELGRSSNYLLDDVGARLAVRARSTGRAPRRLSSDGLIELTSRQRPGELSRDLRRLETRSGASSGNAPDAVVSSNMLSVGIDVQRLALMLMVGQPKTTSEYIQATSRVGRGEARGVVVTLFRSNRARDRPHFETFRPYHEALYRAVEPTSVTPWALNSRDRSLVGAYVLLLRHGVPALRADDAAVAFDLGNRQFAAAADHFADVLLRKVAASDSAELEAANQQLRATRLEWDRRARELRDSGVGLRYTRTKTVPGLLKRFGESGEGFTVMDSMRSVDAVVPIRLREPGGFSNEAN